MLITPAELALHRIALRETYEPGALDFHGANFRQSSPLKVEAMAALAGSEIQVRGRLRTRVETRCDRCLEPVEIALDSELDLSYRPMAEIAREEEIEISPGDLEVGFYPADGLEFEEVVTEQVLLAVPMQFLCKADCRGLCPVCGASRNHEKCRCEPGAATSPFAALREKIKN